MATVTVFRFLHMSEAGRELFQLFKGSGEHPRQIGECARCEHCGVSGAGFIETDSKTSWGVVVELFCPVCGSPEVVRTEGPDEMPGKEVNPGKQEIPVT